MLRKSLVEYLDEYFHIGEIKDDSINGLQVEGGEKISGVALAVDACQDTIQAAAEAGDDMLIVHHGLFWGKKEKITGVMKNRIAKLLESGISLYALHLPLDCHDEVGNNVQLAGSFNLKIKGKFAEYHGVHIGVIAEALPDTSRGQLERTIERVLEIKAATLPFGTDTTKTIGVVSGAAGFFVAEAKDKGCDTLITGETSHTAYHIAKESGMNLIFVGHYASETLGLRALGKHLESRFSLKCRFLSAPTGY